MASSIILTRRQASLEKGLADKNPDEQPLAAAEEPLLPPSSSHSRNRSPGASSTTATDRPDDDEAVGILFLAHDGVANPELWERWRESDPAYADRIRFFVFRNNKAAHPSPFLQRYDLGLRLRTQWCSASIVKATVESLRRVLLFDADVAMVYLVSGFDLPIQPPSALFRTRHVVTEGVPRTVVPFRTVLAFTPHEDEGLRTADGWSKKGMDEDVRSRVACHVQWCGLSRAHVEQVVGFSDWPRLLKLGNRFSNHCCPDEWLLGTILALQGTTRSSPDVIDWPVTDQYRQRGKDQSPILWTDLDATKARVLWAPPSCFRTFTLAALLDGVSRQEGNLFFRKVGPLTPEETERVLAPILVPLHTEAEPATAAGRSGSSGETNEANASQWEPVSSSSSASAASVASDSSSYLEEDGGEDEEEEKARGEEKEEEEEDCSVATAPTTVSQGRSARGAGKNAPQDDDDDDGSSDVLSVPSTPHKRLAAEAALGEQHTKGLVDAARSLRMVGPPGRCAGGRC